MAMNENFIEDATMAFLQSYDVAMRETRNPQIAGMAAMVVTNVFMDKCTQMTVNDNQLAALAGSAKNLVELVTNEIRSMKEKQEKKDARSDEGGGSDG